LQSATKDHEAILAELRNDLNLMQGKERLADQYRPSPDTSAMHTAQDLQNGHRASWERRQAHRDATREDLVLAVAEERAIQGVISEFTKTHFDGASDKEAAWLSERIRREQDGLTDSDWWSDNCLEMFLREGLKGLRRRYKKQTLRRRLTFARRLVWPLLRSGIMIALAAGVYSSLGLSPTETMLASLLLLIYAMMAAGISRASISVLGMTHQNGLLFLATKQLLGKEPAIQEREAIEKSQKDIEKITPAAWIHLITLDIISYIAIWHLVKAIGWF
jgi:hypothetical protein